MQDDPQKEPSLYPGIRWKVAPRPGAWIDLCLGATCCAASGGHLDHLVVCILGHLSTNNVSLVEPELERGEEVYPARASRDERQ